MNKKINSIYPIKIKHDLFSIISRSKTQRKLLNEDDLLKRLRKYGFRLHHFENLTQLEQIKISKKSKIMIGYQGSNLTNFIFMKQKSHLIDIYHPLINNKIFKIQSSGLKINYYSSKLIKSNINLDGYCNINEIEKIIKKILLN